MNDTIESEADLRQVLKFITFRPSCMDMGWRWEISPSLSVMAKGDLLVGWLIRTTFRRPDTDTGVIGEGMGRWWFVQRGSSVDGAVKTAWLACEQIIKHELMEAFLFKGMRVFDPHAPLDALGELNQQFRPVPE